MLIFVVLEKICKLNIKIAGLVWSLKVIVSKTLTSCLPATCKILWLLMHTFSSIVLPLPVVSAISSGLKTIIRSYN